MFKISRIGKSHDPTFFFFFFFFLHMETQNGDTPPFLECASLRKRKRRKAMTSIKGTGTYSRFQS